MCKLLGSYNYEGLFITFEGDETGLKSQTIIYLQLCTKHDVRDGSNLLRLYQNRSDLGNRYKYQINRTLTLVKVHVYISSKD